MRSEKRSKEKRKEVPCMVITSDLAQFLAPEHFFSFPGHFHSSLVELVPVTIGH